MYKVYILFYLWFVDVFQEYAFLSSYMMKEKEVLFSVSITYVQHYHKASLCVNVHMS